MRSLIAVLCFLVVVYVCSAEETAHGVKQQGGSIPSTTAGSIPSTILEDSNTEKNSHTTTSTGSIPTRKQRVAIIGGGIGGAATSYYLSHLPNSVPLEVTLFEKNDRFGGRLKEVVIHGETCEVGGEAWSSLNTYVLLLFSNLKLKLDKSTVSDNGQIGVFEGGNKWEHLDRLTIRNTDFISQLRLLQLRLWRNYFTREEAGAFHKIKEFARYGQLSNYTSVNMTHFLEEHHIPLQYGLKNVLPITRAIYGQGLEVNGLSGLLSMMSLESQSFSVQGGNSLMVKLLAEKSGAKLSLSSTVVGVQKVNSEYRVNYTANGKDFHQELFDYVVIATPIEWLGFDITPEVKVEARKFVKRYVTLVVAKSYNTEYFGVSEVPSTILTSTNSTAPFDVIRPQKNTKDGLIIYKVYSNQDISQYLQHIFIGVAESYVEEWPYTYPDLTPKTDYQPIILGDGLLYLNAIESLVSSMESSTIAAKNAAMLILGAQNPMA